MNMHPDKKGFMLILVMIFIIITAITTYALHMLISSNYDVVGSGMESNTQGYYAAMAGLRYAAIMLRDPAVRTTVANNGGTYTWSINSNYNFLYNDLGLQNPHDVNITITDNGNSTYTTTASYN